MSEVPYIVPITNVQLMERVRAAARADNHLGVSPTHAVLKGDEVVGYYSLGAIPLVNIWHHSERVKARDTMYLNGMLNCLTRERGWGAWLTAVLPDSPHYPLMERLGFHRLGMVELCAKKMEEVQ